MSTMEISYRIFPTQPKCKFCKRGLSCPNVLKLQYACKSYPVIGLENVRNRWTTNVPFSVNWNQLEVTPGALLAIYRRMRHFAL